MKILIFDKLIIINAINKYEFFYGFYNYFSVGLYEKWTSRAK